MNKAYKRHINLRFTVLFIYFTKAQMRLQNNTISCFDPLAISFLTGKRGNAL